MTLHYGNAATPPLARKSGRYSCLDMLGKGTYGACYKVLEKKPKGTPCVMKVIPLAELRNDDVHAAFSEAILLSTIKHHNVVGYLDAWVENSHLYIVMEYCSCGDLAALLHSKELSVPEVLQYARDISCGMQHLHGHKIMHRDIKPSNLFLHGDRLVIGDLGLGKRMEQLSVANTQVGTPLYFSPEVCREEPYAFPSDVWAFGCVLYEMLAGSPPYVAVNQVALSEKICRGPAPDLPARCPPELAQLITGALQKLPEHRPSMERCFHMISSLCAVATKPSPSVELLPVGPCDHTRVTSSEATIDAADTTIPPIPEPQTIQSIPQGAPSSTPLSPDTLQPRSILIVLKRLQSENSALRHRLDHADPTAEGTDGSHCVPISAYADAAVVSSAPEILPPARPHAPSVAPVLWMPHLEQSSLPQSPPLTAVHPPTEPPLSSHDAHAPTAVHLPAVPVGTLVSPVHRSSPANIAPAHCPSSSTSATATQLPSPESVAPGPQQVPPAELRIHLPAVGTTWSDAADNSASSISDAVTPVSIVASTHTASLARAAGAAINIADLQRSPTVLALPSPFTTSPLPEYAAACAAAVEISAEYVQPVLMHTSTDAAVLAGESPAVVGNSCSTAATASGHPSDLTAAGVVSAEAGHSSDGYVPAHTPTRVPDVAQKRVAHNSAAPDSVTNNTMNVVQLAVDEEHSKPGCSTPSMHLCMVEGCLGCEEACRYVQTLERKTAGLQIVLASTKQRAAADRQALALLRREHSELQECLGKGGKLSLSPGRSILRHSPPGTQPTPTGALPFEYATTAGDSNDSIAAFVPESHLAVAAARRCSGETSADTTHAAQQNAVVATSDLLPAARMFPWGRSSCGAESTRGHAAATHAMLQTPTKTPQRLHKRAYVDTPADLRKLLERSLEASRLPEHSTAAHKLAGARNGGYRATMTGGENSTNSSESHESMRCYRAISDRCASDRNVPEEPSMHAQREKFQPFQTGPKSIIAPTIQIPSFCDSFRMNELHEFGAANSTSTGTLGAGSIQGSPYGKMHDRFALVDESPDLSPAACVLQRHPDRMHGMHALHGSSVLQQSCGEWFGSRSSGCSSRLGNLAYLQLSSGSCAQPHTHAVDACDLENAQHSRAPGQNGASGTAKSGVASHAVHAVADAVSSRSPPPAQAPSRQQPPSFNSPAHAHHPNSCPRAYADTHHAQHAQQLHTSDMEQVSLNNIEQGNQSMPYLENSVVDAAASRTVSTGSILPIRHQQDVDVVTESSGSRNSSQGAILDTIAEMRRTLEEDLGAPPSPQQASYQPVDASSQQHRLDDGGIVQHQVLNVVEQREQSSFDSNSNMDARQLQPQAHINVATALEQGQEQVGSTGTEEPMRQYGPGQLQSQFQVQIQVQVQQTPHMLGRCQGAASFTPSPHPKQKRKPTVVLQQTLQPTVQGHSTSCVLADLTETPEATPVKAAAPFTNTTNNSTFRSPHTAPPTTTLESRKLALKNALVPPGFTNHNVLGFLTPQQPPRKSHTHTHGFKNELKLPTSCTKIPATWAESTYSHNLSATPPRPTRPSREPSMAEASIVAPAQSPRLQAFHTPQSQRSENSQLFESKLHQTSTSAQQSPLQTPRTTAHASTHSSRSFGNAIRGGVVENSGIDQDWQERNRNRYCGPPGTNRHLQQRAGSLGKVQSPGNAPQ